MKSENSMRGDLSTQWRTLCMVPDQANESENKKIIFKTCFDCFVRRKRRTVFGQGYEVSLFWMWAYVELGLDSKNQPML